MKNQLQKLALAVILLGSTSSCYRATFYRDPAVVRAAEHEEWTNFYVFGLVGTQDFDVHQFCPTGDVAVAQTGGNFATGLVSVLTIGIYTPRKVYVTCSQSRVAGLSRTLELSLDRLGTPRAARVRFGSRDVPLQVARSGAEAFHLSEGSR